MACKETGTEESKVSYILQWKPPGMQREAFLGKPGILKTNTSWHATRTAHFSCAAARVMRWVKLQHCRTYKNRIKWKKADRKRWLRTLRKHRKLWRSGLPENRFTLQKTVIMHWFTLLRKVFKKKRICWLLFEKPKSAVLFLSFHQAPTNKIFFTACFILAMNIQLMYLPGRQTSLKLPWNYVSLTTKMRYAQGF